MYERFGKRLVQAGREHPALRILVLLPVLLLFGIDALLLAADSFKRAGTVLVHTLKKACARTGEAANINKERIRAEISALRQHAVKRAVAVGLSLALVAGLLPATGAFAADEGCNHVHDVGTCGYVQAVEGASCTHVCDESCGYAAPTAEVPCDKGCTNTDGDGAIDHMDCAYAPATQGSPCTHVHNETCGYVEASAGAPCTHVCDESCGGVSEAAETPEEGKTEAPIIVEQPAEPEPESTA